MMPYFWAKGIRNLTLFYMFYYLVKCKAVSEVLLRNLMQLGPCNYVYLGNAAMIWNSKP